MGCRTEAITRGRGLSKGGGGSQRGEGALKGGRELSKGEGALRGGGGSQRGEGRGNITRCGGD